MKKPFIPIAKIFTTKDDQNAVAKVVASGWILQGPKVSEFEKLIASYVGAPYAVASSCATTALHMSLVLLSVGPGDEVIVPSLSFIASANCIVHAGATPVFVDIDPRTYNLNPDLIEPLITKATKAILSVHQIGLPADMKRILTIAKKHKLKVVEDAACALGARINGTHVGTFGDIGVFSFHPRKAITTAEGGMLVTKSARFAKGAQMIRSHGASVNPATRHMSNKVILEPYPVIGYNYRMSDIHAALGIAQFGKFDTIFTKRAALVKTYNRTFAKNQRIVVPFVPPGFTHAWQSYQVRLPGLSRFRTKIMQKLLDIGIATRAGVMAAHMQQAYRKMYPKLKLPHTEIATLETITLPLYPQMTWSEQTYVITQFEKILASL